VLRILWTQVSDSEKDRLLQRQPDPTPRENLIDGVLVITSARDALGVVVKDEPALLHIKTARSAQPVVVPKSAILKKLPARIFESEAFTVEEMVERRSRAAAENDAAAWIAVGKFAARFKRYELARGFYEKAGQADPSRQADVAALLLENDRLVQEEKAATLLGEVRKALDELDHARALEQARKFLAQFAETRLAQANANLVDQIEKEAKEFAVHRAEVLAAKVPRLWRFKRAELLARAAQQTFAEARGRLPKLDEEIENDLATRLKATVSEIQVAWHNREQKPRVASYGSGTWIARGGQNGGLDFQTPPPQDPAPADQQDTVLIPIRDSAGRVLYYVSAGASGGAKWKELGQPLLRQEEWWAQVGLADRRSWLEAEYSATSSRVRRLEERTRKCAACNGGGMLLTRRANVTVPALCPRCHGVKEDLAVCSW
jgi:tetratricopeptide (TPR) repeat protein